MAAESASSRQSSDPKQDGRSAQDSDKKEEGKPPHDEGLKTYFSQFGEVTDCIVMRDPNTSRSRGFGFLTFVDPSVVNTVLVKEHQLDGKIIDPKRAIPREEQEKTEKIFVGGIAPEVTEEEFKEYFSQFGHVIDATLMVDRDTGRPRGFGFITFDSSEPVEKAMNRQDLEIRNKQIEVKRAMPKHKSQRVQTLYSQQSYGSSSSASAGMMTSPASSANSSYGGYGQYSNYGSYGSNYPSGYPYSAMTHAYYSSRYGNYGSQYGSGGGSYGGSGSRGGSYGQWYGRDGYGSGPSSTGGASTLGGPSSSSRLGGGYRHSPGRDDGYGGNSRSGPARSYSSMNASGTGALYSSHNVRGQHNYHPYAR
ncbi:17066_t:CDS:2 [Cetraspora pellucida]|uniref:17066_t:CDS:1 n=1 Tax=Cetraspora pellucida TaxID=1433469 RepID=A0ACA9KQ95_9GLOM|nr:17066_t:CDS:2 [Cetraspora pellucida]